MVRKHQAIIGCFKVRRLMADDFFRDMSPAVKESFFAISDTVQLDKDAVLIDKGELFNVYILIEGEASSTYYNHLVKNTIKTPIFVNEIVGLVETISNSYSMMRIEAVGPCVFKKIARAEFIDFLSQQPELSLKIVNDISANLTESYRAIESK